MKPAVQPTHATPWQATGTPSDERGRPAPQAPVALIADRSGVVTWAHAGVAVHASHDARSCLGRALADVLAAPGRSLDAGLQLALLERLSQGGAFRLALGASSASWAVEIDASPLDEAFVLCLCQPRTGEASAPLPFDERAAQRSGVDERAVLRALTDNLPISVVALSLPDLSVVSVNRHALDEFAAGLRPALPAPIDAVLGAGMQRMLEPSLRRAAQARQAIEHDFVWPTPGHDSVVSARHVVVRAADGTPQLLVTQLRDITDRRRAEIDLLESELRFKELVEAIDDGVFVTTPGRERMHYFARRLCELYGLAEDEARRDPAVFQRRIHVDDRAMAAQARARELRFEPTDVVFRIQHPETGQRWLRQRTRTRMLPSGELRVYGVVADVTEEREHAMQLQAARDVAEAASQAKSQFMANMSHEIRTPMNGILGMTELLLGTTLNDRQRRFAQAVYRSGESLLEIINDILDFAKIESGRLELAAADFSPRSVVEDTLELLAPRAHEKGLELSFREASDVPSLVHCDPLRLRQVLTNLIANAIKFTEHGEVTIDLRRIAPLGHEPAKLEFRVRDTGIGISREMMPQLFRAFMQGHGGMARRYGGTGLGLAISRQLVELMGGEISVSSAPGMGSEFRFTVRVGEPAPREEVPTEAGDMPPLRVLVIDDNPNNRMVMDNLLGAWGMDVTQASDGAEALALLRAQSPGEPGFDLALVDWHMPGLDGIGFARALRAEGLQGDMKLMLLSSLGVPDDARIAHDNGFSRFIPKPVRKAELRQAILGLAAPGSEPEAVRIRFDCHVLVIEDNAVNQEVMQQMLKRLGCHVSMAASAMDGLRALTERRFDLVLMDIQMPGMDGVEALQWLRGRRGERFDFMTPPDVPVVAVTANALDGDEERFLDLGFDDYVSKPFRQSRLVALLNRFLADIAHERSGLTAPAPFDDDLSPFPQSRPARRTIMGEDQLNPMNPPVDRGSSLDAAALDKLRELDPSGASHLMERVLKAYDSSVSRLVPQLEEAAGRGDLDGVRHVVHTLKSSSASIGAKHLSMLCADTEQAIREQRALGDLPTRVQVLRREIECVQRDLHAVLEASGDVPTRPGTH